MPDCTRLCGGRRPGSIPGEDAVTTALEPDGTATGCNPVQVGSTPTGVSDHPDAAHAHDTDERRDAGAERRRLASTCRIAVRREVAVTSRHGLTLLVADGNTDSIQAFYVTEKNHEETVDHVMSSGLPGNPGRHPGLHANRERPCPIRFGARHRSHHSESPGGTLSHFAKFWPAEDIVLHPSEGAELLDPAELQSLTCNESAVQRDRKQHTGLRRNKQCYLRPRAVLHNTRRVSGLAFPVSPLGG